MAVFESSEFEVISTTNSSTANLASGASFTGTSDELMGYDTITISFKASQNVTIQFQQSPDNSNWDIVDSYTVAASVGDSRTFKANVRYGRVIVTNNGGLTTTFLRLQTILTPIGNPLPKSLSPQGNLLTEIRGGTDNSSIGNAGDRLKVDAALTQVYGQFVPVITNKFKVHLNTSSVSVVAAYTTLYTRSGTGLFFGFQADFNSANVTIKLNIDGTDIFELTLADIKLFQFNDTTTTRCQAGAFLTTIGNTLDFSSKFPIPYSSTVTLSVKRSDGTNHTNNNWIVFLTEDT